MKNTDTFAQKLSTAYIIALSAVALLTLFSQYLVRQALKKQETDGTVVNVAGRQRMLSQRIVKSALILSISQDSIETQKRLEELGNAIKLWEKSHKGLQEGDKTLQLPADANTDSIQKAFQKISPYYIAMLDATYDVIAIKKHSLQTSIQLPLTTLLTNEGHFLKGMNEIVGMYERVAKNKVDSLRSIEATLMCITLLTLLMEALLIFRPAINRIGKYIKDVQLYNQQLQASEEEIRQNLEEIQATQELLQTQNHDLVMQRNQLAASEEEIRQNYEELQAIQEKLAEQKSSLEITIQELNETQTHLIQAEKMASLGQLVASIAHEVNTPLGAIQSSATYIQKSMQKILVDLPPFIQGLNHTQNQFFEQLLLAVPTQQVQTTAKEERKIRKEIDNHLSENGIPNSQELADVLTDIGIFQVQNYVPYLKEDESKNTLQMTYEIATVNKSMQTILSATEKASKVVFALKSYAYQDQHEQQSLFSCIQTIENVLTIYSNQLKQGITVVKHYDEDIAILCYPDELMQVWTNLIHNAIQAMNYQGTLTIVTNNKKDAVEIQITDTGGGIPTAIQDKIFNAFFTTKKLGEGTGLGLDIVKKIVTKHNGKIWFQSTEGEGTTFFVEIPR